MIGYVTIGTNNLPKAIEFYESLLGELGATRMMENDHAVYFMTSMDKPLIGVGTPHDKKAATVGNGMMVALNVDSKEKVDAIYDKAISLGGTDEGPPGERAMPGFYAAYFRDLDGNKLNCYCFAPPAS
jgi:catechol 2,3-dioxygenase-like lactoylglutathione lyase family enzyme